LHFQGTTSRVTFLILGHTGVRCLIRIPFHVLNNKGAIGEDLLLAINWQSAIIWEDLRNIYKYMYNIKYIN